MSVLSASSGTSSGPAALLFFSCFMALLVSSYVGLSHLMEAPLLLPVVLGVQWGRCVQKFLKVSSPSVELLLSSPNVPSFLLLHGSFLLAIFTC